MSPGRRKILIVLGAGVISLLFGRIVHLQVFKGNEFARRAFHSHFRRVSVQPRRGAIWDRSGRLLAVTLTTDSLCADPARVKNPETLAESLAKIIPESRKILSDRLGRANRRFMWLHRGISPEQSNRVLALNAPGLFFKRERRRFYPAGDLTAPMLGFCGVDGRGLEGFEAAMDSVLAGNPGEELQAFDALARPYSGDSIMLREPIQGDDLHLTVDAAIQYFTAAELKRALREENAPWGAAVVMDVNTGDILAMVTEPGFNPHKFSEAPADRRRNRCTSYLVEPGSTFKAVTLAAAVEAKRVHLNDRIYCENGHYTVGRTEFSDWKPFGDLTAEDVIAYSSNIGTIKMAHAVGGAALADFASRLGVGEITVDGIPGMGSGYIRNPDTWSNTATASLSIGYGVALTPLHLVRMYAAFANGGLRVEPRLIASAAPPERTRIMRDATADTVTAALTSAITRGTGKKARPEGFTAAGKTGTARRYDHASGAYDSNRVTCVFAGFAPVDNPRVSVCVVVDDPQIHKWASYSSAGAFARIVNRTLLYLGEIPERKVSA